MLVPDLPFDCRDIPFACEVHDGGSLPNLANTVTLTLPSPRGRGYYYGVDGQNELVRALRKQLEATERELANQKWVFQRYLESPSWRMTAPIRWAAKLLRNLASPSGRGWRVSQRADAPGEGHKPAIVP